VVQSERQRSILNHVHEEKSRILSPFQHNVILHTLAPVCMYLKIHTHKVKACVDLFSFEIAAERLLKERHSFTCLTRLRQWHN
jgi:hypothetical protein